jgi:microcystin-dependent protein
MASQAYIGSIFMFAGNFNPRGYMLCQGQLLPISQYAALFSILGTTYGGNGTTNFALPNLSSRVPVGAGNGPGLSPVVLGEQGGSQNVTLTINQMPAHTHACTVTLNAAADGRPSSDSPADAVLDSGSGTNFFAAASDGTKMNAGAATAVVAPAGANQPVSIQNPYLGITYIIAIQGIFPSRS